MKTKYIISKAEYIKNKITDSHVNHRILKTASTKQSDKYYYQYRAFSDFWKIIDSDELWANNIMFSNDTQEQEWGKKICAYIRNSQSAEELDDVNDEDYYMLCFTEDSDSLSQWRGYAGYGGVAIGFEFNAPEIFHIKPTMKDGTMKSVFINPYQVIYAKNEEGNGGYMTLKDVLDSTNDDGSVATSPLMLIPYIKHEGFKEEKEWRIIISKAIVDGGLVDCVHYRDSEEKTCKIPYIVLRAGLDGENGDDKYDIIRIINQKPFIRLQVKDGDLINIIKNNRDLINIYGGSKEIGKHIINCSKQKTKEPLDFCFLCTSAIEGAVNLHNKKSSNLKRCCGRGVEDGYYMDVNQIVLTQGDEQGNVFNCIYSIITKYNKEKNKAVKVWCEGHLPIRKVVIGPCSNIKDMERSIKHYFENSDQYWLRCVDVVQSELPYRTPQNRK